MLSLRVSLPWALEDVHVLPCQYQLQLPLAMLERGPLRNSKMPLRRVRMYLSWLLRRAKSDCHKLGLHPWRVTFLWGYGLGY